MSAPSAVVSCFNRGRAEFDGGRYVEAVTEYSKAISQNYSYKEAYLGRAEAEAKLGLFEETIKDCRRAGASIPTEVVIPISPEVAIAIAAAKVYGRAISPEVAAIAAACRKYGNEAKSFREAETAYKQSMSLDPGSAETCYDYSTALWSDANKLWREAYNNGFSHGKSIIQIIDGKRAEAKRYLSAAIRLGLLQKTEETNPRALDGVLKKIQEMEIKLEELPRPVVPSAPPLPRAARRPEPSAPPLPPLAFAEPVSCSREAKSAVRAVAIDYSWITRIFPELLDEEAVKKEEADYDVWASTLSDAAKEKFRKKGLEDSVTIEPIRDPITIAVNGISHQAEKTGLLRHWYTQMQRGEPLCLPNLPDTKIDSSNTITTSNPVTKGIIDGIVDKDKRKRPVPMSEAKILGELVAADAAEPVPAPAPAPAPLPPRVQDQGINPAIFDLPVVPRDLPVAAPEEKPAAAQERVAESA